MIEAGILKGRQAELLDGEIYETTLEQKMLIYAAANIPKYWILDLTAQRLIVFHNLDGKDYHNQGRICKQGRARLWHFQTWRYR